MKQLVLLFICTLYYSSTASILKKRLGIGEPWIEDTNAKLPPDEWFEQKLDHSDPTSSVTWKQRYATNATFFKPGTGSPVFLMIGGEGEATAQWLVTGAWITYAEKFGALCFQVEHRYYGKSFPTSDLSVKNLKYLTSEQVLADLAYFVEGMKKKYKLDHTNKWISFGGSYAGSLAAWLRFKYPHIIHAAVSTSGPLLAIADFYEYNEVARASLNTYSKKCSQAVYDANTQVHSLLKTARGRESLYKEFKLCDRINIHNKKDIANLFMSLSDNVVGVVQYNNDNRGKHPYKINIDKICSILVNRTIGNPLKRYAAINKLQLGETAEDCLDYKYDHMLRDLRNIDIKKSDGVRQWIYQTCTEFGFYQTSEKKNSLFGPTFDLKFNEEMCTDIFGAEFTPKRLNEDIFRTNLVYGALDIDVSKVVFVHGSIDPWHSLGLTKSKLPTSPSIFIKGTAHCANMYPANHRDLPQLIEARKKITKLIGEWLHEK